MNLRVTDKNKAINSDPEVLAVIEDVENEMGDSGRVLVRPSGTEPLLRIMAEAPTDELVETYVDKIAQVVKQRIGFIRRIILNNSEV